MPGEAAALRIGILGTRGVPASYSGFETCVEELGARLGARGHDVTVYCRVPHISHPGTTYRGMRLRLVTEQAGRALARVRAHYSWDGVTDGYERPFGALIEERR